MTFKTTTLTAAAALLLGLSAAGARDIQPDPGLFDGTAIVATPAASAADRPLLFAQATGNDTAPTVGDDTTETAPAETAPAADAEAAPAADVAPAADAATDAEAPAADAEAAPATSDETAAEPAATDGARNAETAPSEAAPAADAEAAPAADAEAAPAASDETAAEPAATDGASNAEAAPAEAAPAADAEAAPAADAGEAAAADDQGASTAAPEEATAAAEPAVIEQEITDVAFPFEGPFGKYNQFQLQRGLQVYTEVCSACHGLRYVPIRALGEPNGPELPEDQVRAYAAELDIDDPETGESRPRLPTDFFPHITYAGAPDLSVMAKARAGFHGPYGTGISQLFNGIGGPEYIYSILTHYTGETKDEAGETYYENTAFPGGWIKMAPPLSDDIVTYEDGTDATLPHEAEDVAAFLMWTAEPKMMERKQVGLVSVIFLIILSVLLYLTNKRLWRPIKHRDH